MCSKRLLVAASILACLTASGPARSLPIGSPHALETLPPGSVSVDKGYAEGIAHLARGDLPAAEAAFRESVKQRPTDANAMLGLAEIAFRRNQLDEAGRWIDQAVKIAPDNAHVQASYGRYLAVNRRYREAEVALRKALNQDRQLVQPRMDLGDLYAAALNKPKEALTLYRDVLTINAEHAGAHYAMGVVLTRLGELQSAQKELETAARLEPANPLPAMALAHLHLQRGDWDSALSSVELALKLQPGLAGARELKGDALLARGDESNAAAEYSAAAKLSPKSAGAHLKLGMLYQKNRQLDLAEAAYLKAIEADPGQAHAYNNLAWIAVERNRNLARAEGWAKKATQIAPEEPQFLDTLGWVQRARGDLGAAVKSMEKASRLAPRDAGIQYRLGLVYFEQGSNKAAAQAFQKSIDLTPNSPEAADAKRRLAALAGQESK
jgi:tetratricopeptide (TPR) repeat protein